MLYGPTVLVLGAGASADFKLPDGAKLKQIVREDCDLAFDDRGGLEEDGADFFRALLNDIGDRRTITTAAKAIADAIPSFKSIDDFLFSHSDDEIVKRIGKMAIARTIAQAERSSFVNNLTHPDESVRASAQEQVRRTWIGTLIELLATGVPRTRPDTLFDNLTIISFNYDRCVECILFHMIQPTFRLDEDAATQVIQRLNVLRPYGGLGNLYPSSSPSSTPFGPDPAGAAGLSSRIKVYTEEPGENRHLPLIREAVADAAKVVFLGFGFHKQNMKLLEVPEKRRKKSVYATAFHVPTPARKAITKTLSKAMRVDESDIALTDHEVDCQMFFMQYQLLLGG
jgi:hypothetical protein